MDDQGKRIMTGPHGVDRRALRRNRVLKSALAAYNSQFTTMPCVMRNVSEDGARLEFDELARVPASFVLHVGIDRNESVTLCGHQSGKQTSDEPDGDEIHRRPRQTRLQDVMDRAGNMILVALVPSRPAFNESRDGFLSEGTLVQQSRHRLPVPQTGCGHPRTGSRTCLA